MDNQQDQVKTILQNTFGQANVLTAPRMLLKFLDNEYPATMFLSQLIYWQGKGIRQDGAIAKTFNEWYEEIGVTKRQIYRALTKMPYITTKVHRFNGVPTVHYYLDYNAFIIPFVTFCNKQKLLNVTNESAVTLQSLTETTTEITSKTTNNDNGIFAKAKSAFSYYLIKYKEKTGNEHPTLKPEQYAHVIGTLAAKMQASDLGQTGLGEPVPENQTGIDFIIDRHFDRELKTDWNINHFVAGMIIEMLVCEHLLNGINTGDVTELKEDADSKYARMVNR